jgi:Tfp pilus assembly protein PilF
MKRHRRVWMLGLAGTLLPHLGCVPNSFRLPEPTPNLEVGKPLDFPRSQKEAALACLRTAEAFEKNGKEAEAIHGYELARQQDSSLVQASRRLAVLYDRQGDFAKAEAEYQRALKTFPRDSDLHNDYGYFLYEQERWAEAERVLRQALQLHPQNQRAAVNLGMAVGQQGRHDEAFRQFKQVLTPAEAHANLAYLFATQGKREEAIKEYRQALSLNPNLKPAQTALNVLTGATKAKPTELAFERPGDPTAPRLSAPEFAPTGPRSTGNKEAAVDRLQNFRKEREQAEGQAAIVPASTPAPVSLREPAKNPALTPIVSLQPPVPMGHSLAR